VWIFRTEVDNFMNRVEAILFLTEVKKAVKRGLLTSEEVQY